jgi:hypothetical protein
MFAQQKTYFRLPESNNVAKKSAQQHNSTNGRAMNMLSIKLYSKVVLFRQLGRIQSLTDGGTRD